MDRSNQVGCLSRGFSDRTTNDDDPIVASVSPNTRKIDANRRAGLSIQMNRHRSPASSTAPRGIPVGGLVQAAALIV